MAQRQSIRCLTFVRAETGILERRISMGGLVPYHRVISFQRLRCMTVKTEKDRGRRRRGFRLRRGMDAGAERRKITVFCEGKKTEPTYFRALRDAYSSVSLTLEIFGGIGVPFTIASKAVAKAKQERAVSNARRTDGQRAKDDEVWAVFDRNEHPRYEEAVNLCQAHGVFVARSNPCFELWLILHEQEYDRPNSRKGVQSDLQRLRPEYHSRKGKTPDCKDLVTRVVAAEERAQRQLRNRELDGLPFGNPSTTVGLLARRIRGGADP